MYCLWYFSDSSCYSILTFFRVLKIHKVSFVDCMQISFQGIIFSEFYFSVLCDKAWLFVEKNQQMDYPIKLLNISINKRV